MPNKLEVSLELIDKLTSPLNKAAQNVNATTKRIEGAFKFITAVGAVTGLAAGLNSVVNKSIEFADRIDDVSKRLNMSAESVQQWDIVLKNNSSSMDEASAGFANLNTMAYNAAMGQKKSAVLFKQLGVEVKDSNGGLRDQSAILNDTITKLADVKNSTLQSALAQKLFGSSGTALLPILRQGSDAIREQLEESKKYNIVSGTTVQKLADAKDKMELFKMSSTALSAEFTSSFIPVMSKAVDWLTEFSASWGYLLNKDKDTEKANRLKGIQEEIRGLMQLKQEQQNIVDVGIASKYKLYSKGSVDQAKSNIIELVNQIKELNNESRKTFLGSSSSGGSGVIEKIIDPKADAEAVKRQEENYRKANKSLDDFYDRIKRKVAEVKEEIRQAQTMSEPATVELPGYMSENSPMIQSMKAYNETDQIQESVVQRQIDRYSRLGNSIASFTNMTNTLTEMRIQKMRKEGTLTEDGERKYREQMKKRQIVLASIAIAEAAAAAVTSVKEAWQSKSTGDYWGKIAASVAGVLEVAAVTGTQIAAIKAASFASGVRNFSGGWANVGEQGRELVYLPPGSSVYNAHQTNQMMQQPTQTLHLTVYDNQGNVTREVERSIRSGEFNTALKLIRGKIA